MEFINEIMPSLLDFIAVVIGIALMYAGKYVKKMYDKYVDAETKKDVVKSTVQCVEQVYKDIHGQEIKLNYFPYALIGHYFTKI